MNIIQTISNHYLEFFSVITSVFVVLCFRITRRNTDQQLNDLLSTSDAPIRLESEKIYTEEIEGNRYEYGYFPNPIKLKRHSPIFGNLAVSADSDLDIHFRITTEDYVDKIFKKMDIASEFQTGDIEFDERFYIETAEPDLMISILSKSENRQIIKNIFDTGFTYIENKKGRLESNWKKLALFDRMQVPILHSPTKEINKNIITDTAKNLIKLTESLKKLNVTGLSSNKSIIRILKTIPFILLAIGIFTALPLMSAPDYPELLMDSLKISIPALIVYMIVAFKMLRGRSNFRTQFFIILYFSLFAFPMATLGTKVEINRFLNAPDEGTYEVLVLSKFIRENPLGSASNQPKDHYFITVESWKESGRIETVGVYKDDFELIEPKSTRVKITTKKVFLNFKSVRSVEISDERAKNE